MNNNKLSYKILSYLLHHQDTFISGQQLANMFGVSRTAVWKVMTQLQQQGYEIQSFKNKGYTLVNTPHIMSEPLLTYMAEQSQFCQHVFYHDSVDSTQLQAKRYLAQHNQDFAVIADSQTAGYGRFQRPWKSQSGQGIWMTVVKKSNVPLEKIGQFNLFMACAVHQALCHFVDDATRLKIKWPNDIYYDKQKISGFLSEVLIDENQQIMIIYGLGINVLSAPLIDNRYQAGDLQQHSSQSLSRTAVLAQLFKYLSNYYDDFNQCRFDKIKHYWALHSLVWHQWLNYTLSDQQFRGIARVMTDEGYLIVEDENGQQHTIMSADINF